ncbi:DeoR/GlpR family DNA-binding transcription regulator [Spiroplasma helicoides]|nr:DeoR/GlpR family DNA-binding transcription regulator [Spiroplasma helicoides]
MDKNRHDKIMEYIKSKNELKTKYLLKKADSFGVSEITLRRDLHDLEKQGLITLTYGYIKVVEDFLVEQKRDIEHINKQRMMHKEKMSKIALETLKENDVIFVNTGTTCEEFVTKINVKIKLLVTSSFTIASKAIKNIHISSILFIGGFVDKDKKTCYSNINFDFLNDIYFDKLFTSCVSFKNNEDVFFDSVDESNFISRIIANSSYSCLFIDDYKMEKNAFIKAFSAKNFDKVIYYNS